MAPGPPGACQRATPVRLGRGRRPGWAQRIPGVVESPRARQLEAIAALRGVGKREAAARLEKLKSK